MTPPPQAFQVFFLPTQSGQRFCVFHPAQGGRLRGLVLYVHPFAEELNRTRRMAAQQARALAQAGFAVLQMDLLGCGDSGGDFGDASWSAWMEDLMNAHHWLRQQHASMPEAHLWIWGLRTGCLLAADLARRIDAPAHLLFWQAVPSGALQLQQFLRLQLASAMLSGSPAQPSDNAQQRLDEGQTVDIAGYALTPGLAQGLKQATLAPPLAHAGARLVWLDHASQAEPSLSPGALRALNAWQPAGWAVHSQTWQGPAFWQTGDSQDAAHLLQATLAALTTTPAGERA
jgi:exosortase A-associated hydrolase 2